MLSRLLSFTSARACLLVIAAAAPVLMTRLIGAPPLTHDAYELPKAALVWTMSLTALVAWVFATVREARPVRVSWWLAAPAVYVGWTGLATALSASPASSIIGAHGRMDGFVTALSYGVIGFVAMQVFTGGRELLALVRTLGVSALVVGAYGAAQSVGIDPFYYLQQAEFTEQRAFSFFGNPVFLGGFLVLVLPLQLALALGEDSPRWRVVSWVGVVLTVVSLLGTASRAAWLAALVEVVILTVVMVRKRVGVGAEGWVALGAACLAAAGVIVRGMRSDDQVMNVFSRVASLIGPGDASATERALVARSAVQAIAARPIVGFGPGRFEVAFRGYRLDEHVARFPANSTSEAHSVVLQTTATGGIVAAAGWVVSVVWPLVIAAPHALSRETGRQRIVLAGAWTAVLGYSLFLLVGISVVGATAPMWILLGVLAGLGARPAANPPGRWMTAVGWALAVALVAIVAWSAMLLAADNRYLLARMQVRGMAAGDPVATTTAAIRLSPLDIVYRRHLAVLHAGTDPQSAATAAGEALAVEPADLESLLVLIEAQAQTGHSAQAVRLLQRAEEIAPNDPSVDALSESLDAEP